MPRTAFNKLSSRQKWERYGTLKGKWYCSNCHQQTDKPYRASPFSGAEVCCGYCDHTLTRRTGGGQSDPFNWHYGKPRQELPMDIDYRASGKVIAAHALQHNRYIVLVNTGSNPQPWCVSKYTKGNKERESGTYFREHGDALKEFVKKVTDNYGTL